MNFGDFLHSKRWKLMQNYIYSWGASVVLIGALFKMEHLPGSSVFLGVGLSIEAIIFFISAFEPLMELPDWKVVYPQLRTGDEDERDLNKYKKADGEYDNFFGSGSGGGGGIGIDLGALPDDQLKVLKESFDKISKAASGIKDLTEATAATDAFVKNLNSAAQSIGTVVEANSKVAGAMDESVKEITQSYKTAAEKLQTSADQSVSGINQSLSELSSSVGKTTASLGNVSKEVENSGNDFAKHLKSSASEMSKAYTEMSNSMANGFKGLEKESGVYATNLDKLNKNLSAINAAYELHLKGTAKVEAVVNDYTKSVGEIGSLLNSSIEETTKFNQSTKEINESIQALNGIYGRMLGAMNGKK